MEQAEVSQAQAQSAAAEGTPCKSTCPAASCAVRRGADEDSSTASREFIGTGATSAELR